MYSPEDEHWLTYVQNGILASVLINGSAADYIVTGCGTGMGAMLALNSFPGIICGLIEAPSDAFLFSQIYDGNAISLPYAKGFGWGAEIKMSYIFEKFFSVKGRRRVSPGETTGGTWRTRKSLMGSGKTTSRAFTNAWDSQDKDLVKGALSGVNFKKLFYANAKNDEMVKYVEGIVGK